MVEAPSGRLMKNCEYLSTLCGFITLCALPMSRVSHGGSGTSLMEFVDDEDYAFFLGTIFLFGQSPARIGPSQYQRPMVLRDAGSVLSTQQDSRGGDNNHVGSSSGHLPVFCTRGCCSRDNAQRYTRAVLNDQVVM